MAGTYGVDWKKFREEATKYRLDQEKATKAADKRFVDMAVLQAKADQLRNIKGKALTKEIKEEKERLVNEISALDESIKYYRAQDKENEIERKLVTERMEGLKKIQKRGLKSYADMTAAVSKGLGIEESYRRDISKKVTGKIRADRNLSTAFSKGSSEDKENITAKILEEIEAEYKKAGLKIYNTNKMFIRNAAETVADAMDELVEDSKNIFYPLIQELKNVAKISQQALQEVPYLGRLFTDEMIEHYRTVWDDMMGELSSQMRTILAPIDAIIGPFKTIAKGMFGMAKAFFTGPTEYEKTVAEYTKKLYEAFVNKDKRDKATTAEEKKRWIEEQREKLRNFHKKPAELWDGLKRMIVKSLLFLVAGFGLLLGAVIGKILLPFKVLLNMFRAIGGIALISPSIEKFVLFFKSLLPKFLKTFAPVIKFIGDAITKVKGWFTTVVTKLKSMSVFGKMFTKVFDFIGKYFGKFLHFFKLGVARLAWPLQIVMSLFDFISGFMNTEGNILQKIIGGLENVVIKFLDLPIRAFGWLVEKVAGLFGYEVTGVADTIISGIKSAFDWLKENIMPALGFIVDIVKPIIGFFIDKVKALFDVFVLLFQGDPLGALLKLFKEFNPAMMIYDWGAALITGIKNFFTANDDPEPDTSKTVTGSKTVSLKSSYSGHLIGGELYTPGDLLSENQIIAVKQYKQSNKSYPAGITDSIVAKSEREIKDRKVQVAAMETSGRTFTDTFNKNFIEQAKASNVAIANIANNTNNYVEKDIPAEPESVIFAFYNKSWGMN